MSDPVRAEFEKALAELHPGWTFDDDGTGGYHNPRTEAAWQGWQAALSRAALAELVAAIDAAWPIPTRSGTEPARYDKAVQDAKAALSAPPVAPAQSVAEAFSLLRLMIGNWVPNKADGMAAIARLEAELTGIAVRHTLELTRQAARSALSAPPAEPADTAMLNWVEAQWREGLHLEVCAVNEGLTHHGLRPAATVFLGFSAIRGDTLRKAIDSAMKNGEL